MFQAITTRYIGPSNVRGARIAAFAEAGRITLSWDHSLNSGENHCRAAQLFAAKFGWEGTYYAGGVGGSDIVWVGVHARIKPREGDDMFLTAGQILDRSIVTDKKAAV